MAGPDSSSAFRRRLDRIYGRYAAADVLHPETGDVLAESGSVIDEALLVGGARDDLAGAQQVRTRRGNH